MQLSASRLLLLVFGCLLTAASATPATAQGLDPTLLEPACSADDGPFARAPRFDPSSPTCGGPVTSPSAVYLFSGEFVHHAVDMRIRGRGLDFVWGRTYRSQIGPNVGLGQGWDHSYGMRLARITEGPTEAQNLRFNDKTTLEWDPPPNPWAPTELTYCTLRSSDPADFSNAVTTSILDPEAPDTMTTDDEAIGVGELHSYLILPKSGNREGSLGVDSSGTARNGLSCGVTGPDLILHDGTGRQDPYLLQSNGTWTTPEYFREITEDAGGTYKLTFPDTGSWNFLPFDGGPAAGRIQSIVDRNGNTLSFDYDALGRLVAVTDTLNRQILIGHDANGFLSTVTDFTGRQVRYDYHDGQNSDGMFGDLKSATGPAVIGTPNGNDFPLGKTTAYTYSTGNTDPALNHNLLTITDPRGQRYLQNVYSATPARADHDYDHVLTQIWGDPGDTIDYHYESVTPDASNNFAVQLTIENDRMGNVTEQFFDGGNRNVLRREYTGRAPDPDAPTTTASNRPAGPLRADDPPFFESRWEYDDDARTLRAVRPNLNERLFIYDSLNPVRRSRGNLLDDCRLPGPLSGDQPTICERFEYDDGAQGTNFVTRHQDGRGNPTMHEYDPAGNRLSTTHRITSIVEEFEYNSFGQMTAHTLPDNGSGHRKRDQFTYHTAGPQMGYRAGDIADATGLALVTSYEYDARGNVTSITDPSGNDTQHVVNQLDQTVRRLSRETSPGGPRYEVDQFYDANDNLVRTDVHNVDDNGSVQPNTHYTTIHEYDLLNFPIRSCREAGESTVAIPGGPTLPTCTGLTFGDFLFEEYAYDANRNLALLRSGEAANGNQPDNVVEKRYDERDLLFHTTRAPGSADQSTTQYDYDGNGNLTRVRHGLEDTPHERLTTFDGYDRGKSSTDAMGNVTVYGYDANHNRVSERVDGELVDLPGSTANLRLWEAARTYDALDRLRTVEAEHFDSATQTAILDGQSIMLLDWSDNSQLIARTDDNSNVTSFEYDTVNRTAVVTDAKNNVLTLGYDANSNVVTETSLEKSGLGAPDESYVTTYDYDGLDRRTSMTDNVGNLRELRYDSRGNLTSEIDALRSPLPGGGSGNLTQHLFDGVNRRVGTVHTLTDDGTGAGTPVGSIDLTQEWDDSSRIISRTDDAGNTTRYAYDELNRLINTTYEDGTDESLVYDVHDFPVSRLDPNGSLTELARDLNDRLTRRDITRAPGVAGTTFETFAHDGLSRVVEAQDDDSLVSLSHDSLSNIVEETLNGRTTSCLYDGVGNKLQSVYPGGRIVDYDYDELNRLGSVAEDVLTLADYNYVGPGRVLQRSHGNGTSMTYEYDGLANSPNDFGVKQVVRTTHGTATSTIDDRLYEYGPMYNKTLSQDVTPGGGGRGRSYRYDSRYRLVETDAFDAAGPLGTTHYSLDGVGNRQLVSGGPDPGGYFMDPLTPDPADLQMNQYSATPFDSREYDANGDLLTLGSAVGPSKDATYDYANRMISLLDSLAGITVSFEYDALGRRHKVIVNDVAGSHATHYFYDGWRVCEEQDELGGTQATYVYGRDLDEVLTMRRFGSDFYYHGDEQHNVMAVTDALGNVVERYTYEDYGEPTVFNAAGSPLPGSVIGNPYLFNGRRYDSETGFYYYRTRYLDPRAGRFTTRDTLGLWGDSSALGNAYTYAAGNPATHEDPMGEAIYVMIPPIKGDVTTSGWEPGEYFIADSFSFGVEREMKESGEKGGTEDLNIGIGELQECTASKSMDAASASLSQGTLNGNSSQRAEIHFVEVAGGGDRGAPVCYLKYKLQRCYVTSWSTSGEADDRPTEEVAFYYNKIAFNYAKTKDGKEWSTRDMKWDNVKNVKWSDHPTNKGAEQDRPTEEVAFYYNKIAFSYAKTKDGKEWSTTDMKWDNVKNVKWSGHSNIKGGNGETTPTDRPTEEVAFYFNKIP